MRQRPGAAKVRFQQGGMRACISMVAHTCASHRYHKTHSWVPAWLCVGGKPCQYK